MIYEAHWNKNYILSQRPLTPIIETWFIVCSLSSLIIFKKRQLFEQWWHTHLRTLIRNGNRTEWRPIWSVIIRVITKSDDHTAGVRFVYQEYDYRPN